MRILSVVLADAHVEEHPEKRRSRVVLNFYETIAI